MHQRTYGGGYYICNVPISNNDSASYMHLALTIVNNYSNSEALGTSFISKIKKFWKETKSLEVRNDRLL